MLTPHRAFLFSIYLAASLFAPATALAGTARPAASGRAVLFGTVTALSPSCATKRRPCNFTITTPAGTIGVITTKKSKWAPHSSAAVIAGFGLKSSVLLHGRAGRPFLAFQIAYNPTPFVVPPGRVRAASGVVTGATATQLAMTTPAGAQFTYTLSPATTYQVNGKAVANPTISAGDLAHVTSQLYTDWQQWALTVWLRVKRR